MSAIDDFNASVAAALATLTEQTNNAAALATLSQAISAAAAAFAAATAPTLPPASGTSPDGTSITPTGGGSITDAQGAVWGINQSKLATQNGAISFNNIPVNVLTILAGVVWVQSINGNWYSYAGTGWQDHGIFPPVATQPTPTPTPVPTPTPTPSPTPPPTPPARSPVAITFTADPNDNHVAKSFFGYSIEKEQMMIKGGYDAANIPLVNLYKLHGEGCNLRPGANEWCEWQGGGPGHVYQIGGQSFVSEVDITQLAGFLEATGWTVLYECPLFQNSGGNVAECLAAASIIGQDKITYFQFGNEPDLTGGYGQFMHDNWLAWATAIRNAGPGADFCGNFCCEPPPNDPP